LVTTYLPPLLSLDHTVVEGDEGEEDEDRSNDGGDEHDDGGNGSGQSSRRESPRFPPRGLSLMQSASQKGAAMAMMRSPTANKTSSFRSPRSYSLSDLQNAGYN
jgi:hypothetical protein